MVGILNWLDASLVAVSPATTTVSTPATATAAAAATITTASAATTAAAWTLFPRAGDVDAECASAQVFPVQGVNRLLRLFWRTHGDETESARPAGLPVSDDVSFHHGAVRRKGVLQLVFSDFEVEVSDE
jgi:hypothetical protein